MKSLRSLLSAALLAGIAPAAFGLTVLVKQDTFSTPSNTLIPANGKAATLLVTRKTPAFIKFDLGDFATVPLSIQANNIVSANLRVYLSKATTPTTLALHRVTSPFSEKGSGSAPTFDPTPLTSVAAEGQKGKNIVVFDVTQYVKDALNGDNGLAIVVTGAAQISIPSKESTFPACELNVETNYADNSAALTTGALSATQINSSGPIVSIDEILGGSFRTSGSIELNGDVDAGGTVNSQSVTTGSLATSGNATIGGTLSTTGDIQLSSAANRTVSVIPEFTNATSGKSLTIKAGNAVSGGLAQTGGNLILEAGSGFNINQPNADGGDLILRSGGNTRTSVSTDDGGDIIFQIGSFNGNFIEKARLLEGGNFGLGTVTPEDLFHLNSTGGTRLLISTTANTFAGLRTRSPSHEYFTGIDTNAKDFIVFDNTNNVNRMRILANGNVGIGTDSPQSKLDVVIPATGTGQEFAFRVGQNDSSFANAILVMRTFGTGTPFNMELAQGDAFKPGGGAWSVFSDRRLKKNIEPLSGALDRLLQLRSVTYEYLDPAAVHELPGVQTGFIAQEVEPLFPSWVGEKADGMKFVAIKGFESLTVQALRELRTEKDAEIAALKQQVAALEARDRAREDRLTRLEDSLGDAQAQTVRAPHPEKAAFVAPTGL